MHYTVGMTISNRRQKLIHDLNRIEFIKRLHLDDFVEEFSSQTQLTHYVEVSFIHEKFIHFQNVGMILKRKKIFKF